MILKAWFTSTKLKDRTDFHGTVLFHCLKLISKNATYPEPCPASESVYLIHTGLFSLEGKNHHIFSVLPCMAQHETVSNYSNPLSKWSLSPIFLQTKSPNLFFFKL